MAAAVARVSIAALPRFSQRGSIRAVACAALWAICMRQPLWRGACCANRTTQICPVPSVLTYAEGCGAPSRARPRRRLGTAQQTHTCTAHAAGWSAPSPSAVSVGDRRSTSVVRSAAYVSLHVAGHAAVYELQRYGAALRETTPSPKPSAIRIHAYLPAIPLRAVLIPLTAGTPTKGRRSHLGPSIPLRAAPT